MKQLVVCQKNYSNLSALISDTKQKTDFGHHASALMDRLYDHKSDIPFHRQSNSLEREKARKNFSQQKQQNKENTELSNNAFELLDGELEILKSVLATSNNHEISADIRKEIASIKKVLPPKVISASMETITAIKNSSNIVDGLSQIQDILVNNYGISHNDKRLQKIQKAIEILIKVINEVKNTEAQKLQEQSNQFKTVEQQARYSASAVQSYTDAISSSQKEIPERYTQMKQN